MIAGRRSPHPASSVFSAETPRMMRATGSSRQERMTRSASCRHNGLIPDLTDPSSLAAWQLIELAEHRLFYSLLRWKLPLSTVAEDPAHGLSFEFLADPPDATGPKVLTGHDEG